MLEREIESILTREVKRLGGKSYKWVSPGNSGVPDRIVIFKNMCPIFVELKTDAGKLSKLQKAQIKQLGDLGQEVFTVQGVRGLYEFFSYCGYEDTAQRIKHRFKI